MVCACLCEHMYEHTYLKEYFVCFLHVHFFLSGDVAVGDVSKGMYKQYVYHWTLPTIRWELLISKLPFDVAATDSWLYPKRIKSKRNW